MQSIIDFISSIYSIELITIGEHVVTLGENIAGFLVFSIAISMIKKFN
jgi:hypothetical protein